MNVDTLGRVVGEIESRRMREIDREIEREEREREEHRKNSNFIQVYARGWDALRKIIDIDPGAAKLFALLAEHIDANTGAVICTQEFMAKHLDCSVRTVQRRCVALEQAEVLTRIQVQGRVYAYALNPNLVWRGYNNSKAYAAFNTKVLVDRNGEIVRRLKILAVKQSIRNGEQMPIEFDDKNGMEQ